MAASLYDAGILLVAASGSWLVYEGIQSNLFEPHQNVPKRQRATKRSSTHCSSVGTFGRLVGLADGRPVLGGVADASCIRESEQRSHEPHSMAPQRDLPHEQERTDYSRF